MTPRRNLVADEDRSRHRFLDELRCHVLTAEAMLNDPATRAETEILCRVLDLIDEVAPYPQVAYDIAVALAARVTRGVDEARQAQQVMPQVAAILDRAFADVVNLSLGALDAPVTFYARRETPRATPRGSLFDDSIRPDQVGGYKGRSDCHQTNAGMVHVKPGCRHPRR